ncbi:unnamed protein product [Psylliodes chrysocephalus]|uniref:Uncharacterized protein n=1 Tax=Psylliodes chrysocephalus TaxID=3402493 RepID=A0A9P0CHW9_9CUCU|nr:unnamed protein product [Psylliodes chrysocephala]
MLPKHCTSWTRISQSIKSRLEEYETVDKLISKAALRKFSQYLWYLSKEIAILSLFDDEVDEETKENIVLNIQRESLYDFGKRYIPSKEDVSDYLYGKSLSDFVSIKGENLFSRLKIDENFHPETRFYMRRRCCLLRRKRKVIFIRAVIDTAERSVKFMQDFHCK